jgi:Fe-S-cluster-containing dehydrogenase component/formate-dependent nitrite reductase membrane component NrfD
LQLGFVIDHARCIGCHACTVACKSENDVPLGDFRTWVKYTERGSFPQVRRSFAVLRCNQCTKAPCVTICPVTALDKRPDGIVDVDPALCIGCKSCMQACPYDALYINETSGTAEKCHFCAHRVEKGLAPACAVVCPTEAIIPGDFQDPDSVVAKMRAGGDLSARKTEAGTGPNVFYKEVDEAGIDPAVANMAGGFLWANQVPGVQLDAQTFEAMEKKAEARTVYDVTQPPLWGWKVSAYLFTKSIAAGLFLVLAPLLPPFSLFGGAGARMTGWVGGLGLLFLVLTSGLLIADLRRPERFLKILLRPNWDSWLARGGAILAAFGALLAAWLWIGMQGTAPQGLPASALNVLTIPVAVLACVYTAWLLGQAKGRPYWMGDMLSWHLLVQALAAGSALLLLLDPVIGMPRGARLVSLTVFICLVLHHGAFLLHLWPAEIAPPKGREQEFRRVRRLVTRGPFARRHWMHGVFLGVVVPLALVSLDRSSGVAAVAGGLALWGLWNEEDIFVRAGQALPIH